MLPAFVLLVAAACCALASPAPEVAHFKVISDDAGSDGARIVTFGQAFRDGAVRNGDQLVAVIDGVQAPTQVDFKAFHRSGSVRHAIVSVEVPKLGKGQALKGALVDLGRSDPVAAGPPAGPAPNLQVTLTFQGAAVGARTNTVTLDLPTLVAGGTKEPAWLRGPLVSEQRYLAKAANGVQLAFDVRIPRTGAAQVDLIAHNDAAQNPTIDTQVYDLAATIDGRKVFSVEKLKHYPYATWHKVLQTDGHSPLRAAPDLADLINAGAVPRYQKLRPSAATEDELHSAAMDDAGPLRPAGLTTYMPTSGGRPDIGPLPTWAVAYLQNPSRQNAETLFANADASGSVPWHVRDLTTQGPISIERHPDVWLDYRGKADPAILPLAYRVKDTEWEIDDSHQPSLTYLPYLLTGSQYYRDELAQQAAFNLLLVNPEYREWEKGLVVGGQVRGVAWSLRTLANAAYALPDGPLQTYFRNKLLVNLDAITRRYVIGHEADASGELEGWLPGAVEPEGTTAPWQNDYLLIVLGWTYQMGNIEARPVIEWMANFAAGRFTSADKGFDPLYGTAYKLNVFDPQSGRMFSTWKEAFRTSFNTDKEPVKELDSPAWGGGYAALARASLASILAVAPSQKVQAAYDYVLRQTPQMAGDYPTTPTFAIVPAAAAEPE